MAFGLRCWNAAGVLTVDTTDRLGAHVGNYNWSMAAGVEVQTISVTGVSDTTHYAYDIASATQCNVTAGAIRIQRIRAAYSGAETGTVALFRL